VKKYKDGKREMTSHSNPTYGTDEDFLKIQKKRAENSGGASNQEETNKYETMEPRGKPHAYESVAFDAKKRKEEQ
jgi:hypothetical protein